MSAPSVNTGVVQVTAGAVEAQRVVEGIREGVLSGPHAWLSFCQLATAGGGWKSPACHAFIVELATQAAAA